MVLIFFLAISATGFLTAMHPYSDEQWAKNTALLAPDIKSIILDPWFEKQLAMHRCDNHEALKSPCSDASCFCKQPLQTKHQDIEDTLSCAYSSWRSSAAMDYILWHELARVRKQWSTIDGLTDKNWDDFLFCSSYLKKKNDTNRGSFLASFNERWEQYRGPRIRNEARWWVRQCVLRVEPRTIEWHSIRNNDDRCFVCMNAEGTTIALHDVEHNTKSFYEYPSGKALAPQDNFEWKQYYHHDDIGIFLDGKKWDYDVHASLPSTQTGIGEVYKLSDTVACYTYEPPTSMVYDERHHCIYGSVSICANISVWPLIKPKLSPAMRLCMEAMRGRVNHPDKGYKRDISLSDIISAPWKSEASKFKNLVDHLHTEKDENSKELLTEYIDNNVTHLSKGYVINRLLKKHQGTLSGLTAAGIWAASAKGISIFAGTGLFASLALGWASSFVAVMAAGVYAYRQGLMNEVHILVTLIPGDGQSVPTPLHQLRVIRKEVEE